MTVGDGPHLESTRHLSPSGLQPGGTVFRRYRLKRVLGQGGMGVVSLAFDEKLQREVALKFLPDSVQNDRDALALLKEETKWSLELTHPHIVRIHDWVDDATAAAIVMEYVDGQTLAQLRSARPHRVLEPAELWPWLLQLADALDYAHLKKRVAHRDLKPSNLMVASGGELKVTDFGIARSLTDTVTRLTGPHPVSGTLAFMSPQQLQGQAPSAQDDVYSVGATLFDLLTGKPPFHTGDLAYQISHVPAPSLAERRQELGVTSSVVPSSWQTAIQSCLAKEPSERPKTAGELIRLLGAPPGEGALELASADGPAAQAAVTCPPSEKPQALAFLRSGWAIGAILVALAGLGLAMIRPDLFAPKRTSGIASPASRPLTMPRPDQGWTNSLGQVFVPVPATEVLFSIWETRVVDFESFVAATGYDATVRVAVMYTNGWRYGGDNWRTLGQRSGTNHPVCGLSWLDAQAFCDWLTQREQALNQLGPGQRYRLPTDFEWTAAVGNQEFPWGEKFPPPSEVGNFTGEERDADWSATYPILKGRSDGYARTAPVGSYPPNRLGIFDLGGNVYEYLDGWYRKDMNSAIVLRYRPEQGDDGGGQRYRIIRGGSWADVHPANMTSGYRERTLPEHRFDNRGFRCVLVAKPNLAAR